METNINTITLGHGSHRTRFEGMCAMEAVAWLAGEAHNDSPKCACPVIAAYVRYLNDYTPDGTRQGLRQHLQAIVGTRSTKEVEQRRAYMLANAARVFAASAFDAAGLKGEAEKLRALPDVADNDSARHSACAADAARCDVSGAAADAARYAARAADAARYAADAARYSARYAADAARYSARAAVDAARTAEAADTWEDAIALIPRLCAVMA